MNRAEITQHCHLTIRTLLTGHSGKDTFTILTSPDQTASVAVWYNTSYELE